MIAITERRRMRIASIAVFLFLHSAAHGQDTSAAMTVIAASVEKSEVTRSITATGNVVAWREISVSSEVGGLAVTEIAVDEGDFVAKGQVLARLTGILSVAADIEAKGGS